MKNTVKSGYERKVQEDGSILLEFNAARFISGWIVTPLIFIFVGVFVPFLVSALDKGNLILAIILVIVAFFVFRLAFFARKKIVVYPGVGIEVANHTIPFSEISTLGVETNNRRSLLYIESGGARVNLVACKTPIANALRDEIKVASGGVFR